MCLYAVFFFNCFYLKKTLHLQLNVLYAFKKYREFVLFPRAFVCVCVCTLVFQVSVLKKKKKRIPESQTWNPKPGIPGWLSFTPPLVCTRSGQMAHLIRVVVPAGAANAVNYNDYEYNQRDWHIILHLLNIISRKTEAVRCIRMSKYMCRFFASEFWGWGR